MRERLFRPVCNAVPVQASEDFGSFSAEPRQVASALNGWTHDRWLEERAARGGGHSGDLVRGSGAGTTAGGDGAAAASPGRNAAAEDIAEGSDAVGGEAGTGRGRGPRAGGHHAGQHWQGMDQLAAERRGDRSVRSHQRADVHPRGLPRARLSRDHHCRAAELRSEEHTSELQSLAYLVCRLLLEKKKKTTREERQQRQQKHNTVTAK